MGVVRGRGVPREFMLVLLTVIEVASREYFAYFPIVLVDLFCRLSIVFPLPVSNTAKLL